MGSQCDLGFHYTVLNFPAQTKKTAPWWGGFLLAKFAELEDNYKLALDYYKKAHDITADDSEVEIAIEVLSRK